ncbi:MAG: hypothetical protein KBT02_10205 [Treponema sp.]|nr:hypothetical protein [Candidatus Treponema caballi]
MDMAMFTELIGTMGFPIACVIALFWMWNKERDEHRAESEKWMEAFNKNTDAIRDLREIITMLKERISNDK